MTKLETPDVKLGMSVFGRVSGFPWWPAQISNSPHTGDWTKDGKFWASFFNDRTGAWLKLKELRRFDLYHKDLCFEENASTPKFKRYKDKLEKAMKLAEAHFGEPRRATKLRVLPPGGGGGEVVCLAEEDSELVAPQPKRRRPGRPPGKIKAKKERKTATVAKQEIAIEQEGGEVERGVEEDSRPKRKRMRSSKYDTFKGSVELQSADPRIVGGHAVPAPAKMPSVAASWVPGWPETPTVTRAMAPKKRGRRGKGGGEEGETSLLQDQDSFALTNGRLTRHWADDGRSEHLERGRQRGRGRGRGRRTSLRREEAGARRKQGDGYEQEAELAVTREMYSPELVNVNSSRTRSRGRLISRVLHPSRGRRSVRSRAAGSSDCESSQRGEGTDSEEMPERERRVATGSLVAAAEDLVEYAVRGGEGGSNLGGGREDIHEMHSVVLGGTDMVCSILNRLSDLERDVLLLRGKAAVKEKATLGEDATAAGLKSAVEAMASASVAFAKARQYDSGVISKSLHLLWADGHFPLSGADGDLLRTVARSLVLASCKRRHEQVSREQNKGGGGQPHLTEQTESTDALPANTATTTHIEVAPHKETVARNETAPCVETALRNETAPQMGRATQHEITPGNEAVQEGETMTMDEAKPQNETTPHIETVPQNETMQQNGTMQQRECSPQNGTASLIEADGGSSPEHVRETASPRENGHHTTEEADDVDLIRSATYIPEEVIEAGDSEEESIGEEPIDRDADGESSEEDAGEEVDEEGVAEAATNGHARKRRARHTRVRELQSGQGKLDGRRRGLPQEASYEEEGEESNEGDEEESGEEADNDDEEDAEYE